MSARRQRQNDTGLVRPYRHKPADFRERYLEMGWDGIDEHYGTNWRVIRRWIIEEGRDQLRADRAAVVAAERHRQGMKTYAYRMAIRDGSRTAPTSSPDGGKIAHRLALAS